MQSKEETMAGRGWLTLVLVASTAIASAQDYPAKPIRLVAPYPAGGPVDATARILAEQLNLGQKVIVDNRSGAGGSVGAESVARAAPDGYTLLLGNSGPITINPVLRTNLGYDPLKDLAPVTWLTSAQMVLMVHPSVPVRSVQQLVALAKAHPGELNYGSAGIGNTTHLGMELFQSVAKVKLHHIPYKGVAPAYVDLMGGQLATMFGNVSGPLAYIRAGRLRALGVTGPKPSPVLPGVQRIGELYPGFELVTWMGIFLPAGTPEAIRSRLEAEFLRVLKVPAVNEKLVGLGNEIIAGNGKDLEAMVRREQKLYAGVIKSAGIKPQ
jgi:tripartite-type tricarboxylate transporter receptor subunit TctC